MAPKKKKGGNQNKKANQGKSQAQLLAEKIAAEEDVRVKAASVEKARLDKIAKEVLIKERIEAARAQEATQKKHNTGTQDLQKINNNSAEENSSTAIDQSKLQEMLQQQTNIIEKAEAEYTARDKALAEIVVKEEDIAFIVSEFELGKDAAEKELRLRNGEFSKTLRELALCGC